MFYRRGRRTVVLRRRVAKHDSCRGQQSTRGGPRPVIPPKPQGKILKLVRNTGRCGTGRGAGSGGSPASTNSRESMSCCVSPSRDAKSAHVCPAGGGPIHAATCPLRIKTLIRRSLSPHSLQSKKKRSCLSSSALTRNPPPGQGQALSPARNMPAIAKTASIPGKPGTPLGRANNAGMDSLFLGTIPVLARTRPKRITFGCIWGIPLRNLAVIPLPIRAFGLSSALLFPLPLSPARRRILTRHCNLPLFRNDGENLFQLPDIN